jgi:hypothetical protein
MLLVENSLSRLQFFPRVLDLRAYGMYFFLEQPIVDTVPLISCFSQYIDPQSTMGFN